MAERVDHRPTEAELTALRNAWANGKARRAGRPCSAATSVEVLAPPESARGRVESALRAGGQVIPDPTAANDSSIWGLVRSGDSAPALVRVQVAPGVGDRSRVHIRATGLEGLIKHEIGAKAADRLAAAVAQN